jgi:hypothetical protein
MQNNTTLETAAFTGIITLFVIGFFIYVNILQQAVNFIIHLPVNGIQH